MRLFEGIHWLLLWMVLYLGFYALWVGAWGDLGNLATMLAAFVVTVAVMWLWSIRPQRWERKRK